jgi:tRNA(Ile)-lysidine synthetase-like protein
MRSTDKLELQVLDYGTRQGLWPQPGETLLVALSGGGDSMCLLALVSALAPQLGIRVAAAHYHHGLRPEADGDQVFVEDWCKNHQIPLFLGRGDVAQAARSQGTGIEDTARRLRYAFLEETAQEIGAAAIATAHHREDQAETVLLHLLRGSGLQGLGGMAPKRGKLIRPLLEVEQEELRRYNEAHAIPHVEDGTNQNVDYTRNFLRHQVMPLLGQRNPQIAGALCRMAEGLRRDNDLLLRQTEEAVDPWLQVEAGAVSLPRKVLLELPHALRPRGVQRMVEALGEEQVLSALHRQQVIDLAQGEDPSGWVPLPQGLVARREYERLILARLEGEEEPPQRVQLPLPGVLSWQGLTITAHAEVYQGQPQEKDSFWLRLEDSPLWVRPRAAGDQLTPVGRRTKPLKKWLIDEKIPKTRRSALPVLEQNGTICGVLGLGADCSAHPKPGEAAWHITASAQPKQYKLEEM